MFYSHEILTSPEHGVATIWLVATLGSKSIARRVNRKAILDVDVPRACGVIKDPEAPMALRLQGNLLYGISRVYNQQCGYALTDVQSVHDRMRSILKVIAGGGLDPTAGKARPDQLVLPYDPSFLPETNLPGLNLDLSNLTLSSERPSSRKSTITLPRTPDLSQSNLSQSASPRLSFSSEDIIMQDWGRFGSESDITGSVNRDIELAALASTALEEQGILLQPDFEFDEDGNLVELGTAPQSGEKEREGSRAITEGLIHDEDNMNLVADDYQHIPLDDNEMPFIRDSPVHHDPGFDVNNVEEELRADPAIRRRKRTIKTIPSDSRTAFRNTELAGLNSDYVQNMAAARKQKLHNQLPTQAKKNAFYWVFGQGIGAVGVGIGTSHFPHPLGYFSGEQLQGLLDPHVKKARKRKHAPVEESDSESDRKRSRVREEDFQEEIGRGAQNEEDNLWQGAPEIGRHASSALRDDDSSQMPWNITASIQSSRQGPLSDILRGVGSASDLSSRMIPSSSANLGSAQLGGPARARSRLTSASPLAGRGFPFDIEGADTLGIPGAEGDDLVYGEDFDLSQYLQAEGISKQNAEEDGDGDAENTLSPDAGAEHTGKEKGKAQGKGKGKTRLTLANQLHRSTLDRESLNFLDFLTMKLDALRTAPPAHAHRASDTDDESAAGGAEDAPQTEMTFTSLLPPSNTSCTVATHGFMHILTLATKGFLVLRQEPYVDESSAEYGVKYRFGEIVVGFEGV